MKAHYPKPFNFEAHAEQVEKASEQIGKPRNRGVCIPNKKSADTENKVGQTYYTQHFFHST